MINEALFSRKSDEWATPQDLFDRLNNTYLFTLDPCATKDNAKCSAYYTATDDGLKRHWTGSVFVNPPYSQIKKWVKKAAEEALNCDIIVMLIPARTDTSYFHDYIYKKDNVQIEFLRGRLRFGKSKNSAPFPSMLVYFKGAK
jgi:site-specific DNA-methyltransferase (adenine-specific)